MLKMPCGPNTLKEANATDAEFAYAIEKAMQEPHTSNCECKNSREYENQNGIVILS